LLAGRADLLIALHGRAEALEGARVLAERVVERAQVVPRRDEGLRVARLLLDRERLAREADRALELAAGAEGARELRRGLGDPGEVVELLLELERRLEARDRLVGEAALDGD